MARLGQDLRSQEVLMCLQCGMCPERKVWVPQMVELGTAYLLDTTGKFWNSPPAWSLELSKPLPWVTFPLR